MKKSLIVMSLLSITACGGGGGSASTGDVNTGGEKSSSASSAAKTYSLQKLNSTTLGTVYTAQLTGVDSDGIKYTGSVSLENRAEKVSNGVLVTPREHLLSYTPVGGSVAETSIGTDYIDTATGNLISLLSNGITCTSISPYHMPASVKIGDFGVSSTLTCSNKDTQEGNWRAEDAGSGNIRIVLNDTVKNSLGNVFSVEEDSYTLDTSGNVTALKVSIIYTSNSYTLTLSSK